MFFWPHTERVLTSKKRTKRFIYVAFSLWLFLYKKRFAGFQTLGKGGVVVRLTEDGPQKPNSAASLPFGPPPPQKWLRSPSLFRRGGWSTSQKRDWKVAPLLLLLLFFLFFFLLLLLHSSKKGSRQGQKKTLESALMTVGEPIGSVLSWGEKNFCFGKWYVLYEQ